MTSILNTIKSMLGIGSADTTFDTDIIIDINSVFATLIQIGVGPSTGFAISDSSANWTDFINDTLKLENLKSYIYLKVRLLFDPPSNSFTIEAIERQIKEFEWRLNVQAEEGVYFEIPTIGEEDA